MKDQTLGTGLCRLCNERRSASHGYHNRTCATAMVVAKQLEAHALNYLVCPNQAQPLHIVFVITLPSISNA